VTRRSVARQSLRRLVCPQIRRADPETSHGIDWLIRLPRALERTLRQELADLEEQTKMPYVTSWEQFAREEGEQRGEAKALLRLLQVTF
jgi:hypothetical protein